MKLNHDFNQRVVVTPEQYNWVDSPIAGVQRMMLDRIGDEVARATSLVRYAPNSSFPEHSHGGGEEILVLSGTFADEHGEYPQGSYLRNPIGTSHSPKIGPEGATIFVKLHQFSEHDTAHFAMDTQAASWSQGLVDGLEVMNGHGRPFDDGNGRWNNWQSMLNAGQPLVAVGCSDDHGGDEVDFPRSYVPASSDAGREVSDQEVVDAFQAGQLVVSAGAFARVWLGEAGLGELVTVDEDTSEVDLDVHIEAIPEVDVTFVCVFVNCDEVLTVAATDPEGIVKLSDTLTVELPEDSDASSSETPRWPARSP